MRTARRNAKRTAEIRVKANQVALVLTIPEAHALLRFCERYDRRELGGIQEAGAYRRALDKIYEATSFCRSDEPFADDRLDITSEDERESLLSLRGAARCGPEDPEEECITAMICSGEL